MAIQRARGIRGSNVPVAAQPVYRSDDDDGSALGVFVEDAQSLRLRIEDPAPVMLDGSACTTAVVPPGDVQKLTQAIAAGLRRG
jgi:hypothetical protein